MGIDRFAWRRDRDGNPLAPGGLSGDPAQALDLARQALPCLQQVERMLGTPRAAQERSVIDARLSELGA